ncbi:hypothetical protein J6590_059036 [Homalodisca vitripennis]|nr:hypothetical protein J6590_059036 [Homalodisca vitripennis]
MLFVTLVFTRARQHMFETMLDHGLVQCVDRATRVTDHSTTCLDLCEIRQLAECAGCMLQTTVTDHYSTVLALGNAAQDTPSLPITYIDRVLFTDILTNTHWEPLLNCCDTNECANSFAHIVSVDRKLADEIIISGNPVVGDSDFRLNTDFTIHVETEQEVARQNHWAERRICSWMGWYFGKSVKF